MSFQIVLRHPKYRKAKSLHMSFISTLPISQICLQNMKGRYSGCVPCSEFDLNLFVSQSLNLPTHQRQISHHSYLSAATMWSTTVHTAAQLFSKSFLFWLFHTRALGNVTTPWHFSSTLSILCHFIFQKLNFSVLIAT